MRLHRFYVSKPLGEEEVIDTVSLIDQWIKVFRYSKDNQVILFNGNGFDVVYTISEIEKKRVFLKKESSFPSITPEKEIHLFVALIKKDLFELVVQKSVELGVSSITPLITDRSIAKNLSLERLTLIAQEAMEQCGRGDRFTIHTTKHLKEAIFETKTTLKLFSLNMEGDTLPKTLEKKVTEPCGFFIGPEGGWSPEEKTLFIKENIASVSLAKQTLRAETAAIALASIALSL
jgi:16S rRNA (uracil1498-N3)-methyltransferase